MAPHDSENVKPVAGLYVSCWIIVVLRDESKGFTLEYLDAVLVVDADYYRVSVSWLS
jgi:hypothetical protein